jgi:hypothetical protein
MREQARSRFVRRPWRASEVSGRGQSLTHRLGRNTELERTGHSTRFLASARAFPCGPAPGKPCRDLYFFQWQVSGDFVA